MKKLLSFVLLLLLVLAVLTACGGNKTPNDTTNTDQSGEQTEAPKPTYSIPEKDMRDWVVDYMYQMANVKWSPMNNIDTDAMSTSPDFIKGKVYHGLPYINLLTDADLEMFINDMRYDETKQMYIYETAKDRSNTMGNDCSSSILLAWKRFDTNITAYDTGTCFPLGDKTGIYPLGNMVIEKGAKKTDAIIAATNEQTLYEAYTLLQKGDMIIWRTNQGHTRMIIENHTEKTAAGKIHPARSYVITIEQTNKIDATRTDGVQTTWYVEHKYTYKDLRDKNYIPVTCNALSEERAEPVVVVEGANTKKTIGNAKNGNLMGTIKSNYSILSATVVIEDANKNELYKERYKVANKDLDGTLALSEFKFDFDNTTLASGTYTYNIIVETVCGEGVVHNVEFTK